MRKLLSIILMCLMFLPIGMAVQYTPLPIVGKVEGLKIPVDVRVTNLRTGVSVTTLTNEFENEFEYFVEWANTNDNGGTIIKYFQGDRFEIRVLICEDSPKCVREVTYSGGGIFESFDLTGIQYVDCVLDCEQLDDLCPEELREFAEDMMPEHLDSDRCYNYCFEYFDCNLCDCPACDSCCLECPVCEEDAVPTWILWVLSFFGITVPAGLGVKFVVRRRKGTGKLEVQLTQHKHKLSPKGNPVYHSINAIHSHEWFIHPKGLKAPWDTKGWGTGDNPFKEEV